MFRNQKLNKQQIKNILKKLPIKSVQIQSNVLIINQPLKMKLIKSFIISNQYFLEIPLKELIFAKRR